LFTRNPDVTKDMLQRTSMIKEFLHMKKFSRTSAQQVSAKHELH